MVNSRVMMHKKLIRAIDRAVILATENTAAIQHKHSCILLDKKHNMVAYGCNHCHKSHPEQAKQAFLQHLPKRIFLHAEIHSLLRARSKPSLDLHTAICIRVKREGSLGLFFPCAICFDALMKHNIKRIIYSTNEQTVKDILISSFEHPYHHKIA
jgi:tRNA(Arg) A34 adenosine deaminase TadA